MIELTLRDFRLKLGMTVDDMAEELNVPKQTYWYWEGKNKPPEDAIQKVRKIYDKAKEFMVDDGIDIIEKIGTIKRHYSLSYDSLAQLVGAKYGTSVVNWMNGVQPRLKYMIRINELYYGIANKKRKTKAGSRATFCRINPLDRESWKAEIQSPIITWR
ncbi:TPA: helix-turn-helix transcriptional regulator [Streptococcus suis 14A]|uniref:helix-turn-helix transcriptional regulator n=1 Tax=Streptococcus suis TaxID=1307 RepID=UPI00042A0E49|nr:helix-turn-helix transcriptional regulator [Streptococcus suis]HEM3198453.1 helix-turn-helix transcriptional regulator [Streptococcus suis 14A]